MEKNLTLDEVCRISNCSRPTIYRRIKTTGFPKPKKVPATAERGPRSVHRWDHAEVMKWLREGHDPRWPHPTPKQLAGGRPYPFGAASAAESAKPNNTRGAEAHINKGGLVLCVRKRRDSCYHFQWQREDVACKPDQTPKFLKWVKKNILFIEPWRPLKVGEEELLKRWGGAI